MYKITFPIPVVPLGNTALLVPTGLARDLIAQLKVEPQLRIICPVLKSKDTELPDYVRIDRSEFPGFSWRLLPWTGGRRQFWLRMPAIWKILAEEAAYSTVWHAACGTALWDITALSFVVGRRNAPGLRILALDSDPAAMLEKSNTISASWVAARLLTRYKRWAAEADATVMMGEGVLRRYGPSARRAIETHAVWLNKDDLASASEVDGKFGSMTPLKMVLASRLLPWKGADDVIEALKRVGGELGEWHLEIIGEGSEREGLGRLAAALGDRVSFRGNVPYGVEFFSHLRQFHLALVPTRATEEARIAYDAVASGCVVICSRTSTLESALKNVPIRYTFEPGDVESLAQALRAAIADAPRWGEAAKLGIASMRGRTIDEMHAVRHAALANLRKPPSEPSGASGG